jgi:hypothetical protein
MLPTTVSGGFLKRINLALLDELDRHLVRYCFPRFGGTHCAVPSGLEAPIVRPGESLSGYVPSSGIDFVIATNRRYSGSISFPVSRYYTLASGPKGIDGGTFKNELMSYSNNFENGLFLIHDVGLSGFVRNPDGKDFATGILVFALIDTDKTRNRFLHDFQKGAMVAGADRAGRCIFARIPYEIAFEVIDNVFDLRLPQSQEYIVDLFNNSSALPFKTYGNSVREFWDCLPALLGPDLGGNEITDEIGRHLQCNGVSGLVFPSARSDVGVTMKHGKIVNMRGWNFVDFRGVETIGGVVDARTLFLLDVKEDIKLYVDASEENKGSWDLVGLQKRSSVFDWESLSSEQSRIVRAGMDKFLANDWP